MGQGPFIGRNGLTANGQLTVANTTTTWIVANSTGIWLGNNSLSNTALTLGTLQINSSSVGQIGINSTAVNIGLLVINGSSIALGANIFMDTGSLTIGNSTVNLFSNSTLVKLGLTTANTTALAVGSNVFLDSGQLSIGNTTVNTVANSIGYKAGAAVLNSSAISIGNVTASGGGILVGNSTVNTSITPASVLINGSQLLPATTDIGVVLGDGTNVIPLGATGRYFGPFDFGGQIVSWSIIGQESGSVVIDVWKCTYAQFDAGSTHPVAGDKISGTGPISLSSATKNQGGVASWTANTFAVGDIFAFNANSVTTSKQVTIFLKVLKTS